MDWRRTHDRKTPLRTSVRFLTPEHYHFHQSACHSPPSPEPTPPFPFSPCATMYEWKLYATCTRTTRRTTTHTHSRTRARAGKHRHTRTSAMGCSAAARHRETGMRSACRRQLKSLPISCLTLPLSENFKFTQERCALVSASMRVCVCSCE